MSADPSNRYDWHDPHAESDDYDGPPLPLWAHSLLMVALLLIMSATIVVAAYVMLAALTLLR